MPSWAPDPAWAQFAAVARAAAGAAVVAGGVAGPVTGRLPLALALAAGGLDEARRRHAEHEGAADEQQRLPAGEVLDVADDLADVVLAQVAGERLGLVGRGRRELGELRLLGLHVGRDPADAVRDGLDAGCGLVEAAVGLLEADVRAALDKVAGALTGLLARLGERMGGLARRGADVLAGARGVEGG